MPLWAGQSAGLSGCTDVVSFLTSLVESVNDMSCPILEWDHATSSAPAFVAGHLLGELWEQ
jgi:hypothetical protein